MTGTVMRVGDEGQRYEVTCVTIAGKKMIIGWSETREGADSFVKGVNLHPALHNPIIIDRGMEVKR
ncbi:hypothetical protein KAR91_20865 [Candidatus Pacearchaeota archaeon]|nr:hypothetical protein [Candidatus Pacearchaeota archaeon]